MNKKELPPYRKGLDKKEPERFRYIPTKELSPPDTNRDRYLDVANAFTKSDNFTVKATKNNGLGCFAKQYLEAYDEVIECSMPITHAVADSYRDKLCDLCFNHKAYAISELGDINKSLSQCSKCKIIKYCSRDCQVAIWGIHKLECQMLAKAREYGIEITADTILFLRALIFLKESDSNQKKEYFTTFVSNDFSNNENELRKKAKLCGDIFTILTGYKHNEESLDYIVTLTEYWSLISSNIIEFPIKHEGDACALGFYSEFAYFNHSCEPNAFVDFKLGVLATVRPIRPILKGEEITISYIDPCLTYQERKNLLLDRYGFLCKCKRCTNTRKERSLDKFYRCHSCTTGRINIFTNLSSTKNNNSKQQSDISFQARCLGCSKIFNNISGFIEKENEIMEQFQKLPLRKRQGIPYCYTKEEMDMVTDFLKIIIPFFHEGHKIFSNQNLVDCVLSNNTDSFDIRNCKVLMMTHLNENLGDHPRRMFMHALIQNFVREYK